MIRDFEHLLPEDYAADSAAFLASQEREANRAEDPRPTHTHVPVTYAELKAVANAARGS